jgi:hypothetical protein
MLVFKIFELMADSTHSCQPRWASLAKKALGTAAVMGVLGAGQAQALVVTVDNQQWDVTTFEGTYNNNIPLLQSQEWWDIQATAEKFASAVGNGLNFPNLLGTAGPYFAFSEGQFNLGLLGTVRWVNRSAAIEILGTSTISPSFPVSRSTNLTWATATRAVPGPLPILGVAAAFGFSRKLRKRIKLHKGTSAVSTPPGS